MTNKDLCQNVFEFLKQVGTEHIIVCAGARNAPLVIHLETEKFHTIHYFEERSASFFALGLIKKTGKPVAVMTTSGTAVAELLPATVEAFYQGLPLILVTADRPKAYRNSGAPQSINHVGMFSHYVEQTFDWDGQPPATEHTTRLQKPIHLNVCFDEPLIDDSSLKPNLKVSVLHSHANPIAPKSVLSTLKKPLVIVSELAPLQKNEVIEFLKKLKAPVYLEALSQLRGHSDLNSYRIDVSDVVVKKLIETNVCDSVIRIGGIPTLRFWRDLEFKFKDVPVINFTNLPFSGLSRLSQTYQLQLENVMVPPILESNLKTLPSLENLKAELFEKFPLSEPAMVFELSKKVEKDPLYLGNSLPIREWDLFARACGGEQLISANRGANGIDGQISTYLGWALPQLQPTWCFIGDLTALYDLAALGMVSGSGKKNMVIMNNFGGQIFNRVFNNDRFINSHRVEFEMLAKMWGWNYLKITTVPDFDRLSLLESFSIIEIQPDSEQTKHFWSAWDAACNKI
ncbi:MAG: 2-succinyl-5-enolpyruvyl-6-hydroxy-3-cyclohexene-1-carboxylic-acid synthase [Bdellovibrionales bacterium RIFCSPHIGHO2_01_FULL_40_29]|nr:MAG: 2-succinyl-5-enolpyruvyl-6-hydroxy-3-cyclohexene-1-carboxylic-acid synthase [Bdellovibrionales bacterium RIFCSPHIGHO2_01_FULL_40_29]OFZ35364.1 MAG: 2-succinyl-5-enolpyruvyl-6-hydroxy-3-cyclohexene-1-carboxylic-acid synthase [Bdellovibrionales bacterium RIFCSPHIGHO2_02_FULL_40_15]